MTSALKPSVVEASLMSKTSQLDQLSLRITEIFYSLQGETRTLGLPTTFVRLTGCPLRCHYCDTAYAFSGGRPLTLANIITQIGEFPGQYITVTGGEPLAQPNVLVLLRELCDRGYQLSIETGGAMDISGVDPRVSRVLDLKTPDSGEVGRNLYSNIAHLTPHDQIKFVLCSRADYLWARLKIDELGLEQRVGEILLSPSCGQLQPRMLADWIVEDGLQVRMQLQLHKLLWGDAPGY